MRIHEGEEWYSRKEAAKKLSTTTQGAKYALEEIAGEGVVGRVELPTRPEVFYRKKDVDLFAKTYRRRTNRPPHGMPSHEEQSVVRIFEGFERKLSLAEIVTSCQVTPQKVLALYQYWKRDLDDGPPQSDSELRWEREMRKAERKLELDEQRLKLLARKASAVEAKKQIRELDK